MPRPLRKLSIVQKPLAGCQTLVLVSEGKVVLALLQRHWELVLQWLGKNAPRCLQVFGKF